MTAPQTNTFAMRKVQTYDGPNTLIQLDNQVVPQLLPRFIGPLRPSPKIVDLGCGTGRSIVPLLKTIPDVEVVGLDASDGMLEVARRKSGEVIQDLQAKQQLTRASCSFEKWDLLQGTDGGCSTAGSSTAPPEIAQGADGITSNLVIEHLPLEPFFRAVSGLLKPEGTLMITNMHQDKGFGGGQAEFVDAATGHMMRGTSYFHSVEEVIAEAAKWKLEVIGDVLEKGAEDIAGFEEIFSEGDKARKRGQKFWFGICFIRRKQ